MMKSDQYTDSLFKNLERLEVQPSDKVWTNIESRLEKKKKRLIPIFLGWGLAASVLLLVGLFLLVTDDSMNNKDRSVASNTAADHGVVDSGEILTLEKKEQGEGAISSSAGTDLDEIKKSIVDEDVDARKNRNQNRSVLAAVSEKEFEKQSPASSPKEERDEMLQKIKSLTEVRLAFVPAQTVTKRLEKQPSGREYPVFTMVSEQKSAESSAGITLGGEYSPTYAYRDVSGVATSGMNESGLMTSGGGFNLAVKMNSRWQIETGVKYAMLGQEVNPKSSQRNVYSTADFSAESSVSLKEVQLTNSMGTIDRGALPTVNADVPKFQRAPNAVMDMNVGAPVYSETVVLEQNLNYLQVPFTLRYELLQQGSVRLSLAGGIGANWLVDNNAYLEMSGQRQHIGQTGGISDLSFSTHAGVAVSIPLYQRIGIKMEPRINYFLSDISDGAPGKFRPYSFGVFTGLYIEW